MFKINVLRSLLSSYIFLYVITITFYTELTSINFILNTSVHLYLSKIEEDFKDAFEEQNIN